MSYADDTKLWFELKSEPEPDSVITAIEKMIEEQFPDEDGATNTSGFIISYCMNEILRFREALLEAWLK